MKTVIESHGASAGIQPDHLILLFVGSERTGSTLLGQLLNLHPSCLIANEFRLVARALDAKMPLEDLAIDAAREALGQFAIGLERWGRFAPSNAKVQPRWQPMAGLAPRIGLDKRCVTVVGDKKAGAVAQLVIDRPSEVRSLVVPNPRVRLLHVLRDPVAAARSAVSALDQSSFEAALEQIVSRHAATAHLRALMPERSLCIAYESMCRAPTTTLREIATWLGIGAPPEWLEIAAGLVAEPDLRPADEAQREAARRSTRRHAVSDLFESVNATS